LRNIKLTLAYDGINFYGYELQPGKRTIRGEIEKALQKIIKQKISIVSSSRTDAGVHALYNVINFKSDQKIPIDRIPAALNSILPDDIRVLDAEEKGNSFNSRFDPKSKEYEYIIYYGDVLPPVLRGLVWHVKPKMDLSAMKKAAKYLVGKHNFSSFCASGGDDDDFVRTIYTLDVGLRTLDVWRGAKFKVLSLKVIGDGYLYKMVRNIVGTLVGVGLGKLEEKDVSQILKAKDRKLAGRTAPAKGLCLVKVSF